MRKIKRRIKPYYKVGKSKLYQGHVLSVLKSLPSEIVQCCITSPPYWGLRDYKTDSIIWDNKKRDCDHKWIEEKGEVVGGHRGGKKTSGIFTERGAIKRGKDTGAENKTVYAFCEKCGAWQGSLGLEPTPDLYVKHITDIFREVKRILKKDGTIWVNIGDSYCSMRKGEDQVAQSLRDNGTVYPPFGANRDRELMQKFGLKHKDLVGIPWRVAFSLQADGWYLRNDIIWNKPNPMPESVKDRCTKSHEYIFMLAKSQKYYYDYESVMEKAKMNRWGKKKPIKRTKDQGNIFRGLSRERDMMPETRNKKSVWTVRTKPFPGAHFAVFPPELILPCIQAGSKNGSIILDPFMGSGTVAALSEQLDRNWIGIELSEDYCNIIINRVKGHAERRMSSLF